jgi:hypothetical protein
MAIDKLTLYIYVYMCIYTQYVEHIHNLLADGGIWINLGPLLYHYSDSLVIDYLNS